MALYNKYRPRTLDEMIGNAEAVETVRGLLASGDIPHAWLFHGPTGCGKTTLGRIVAKELRCHGSDYREIDSAQFRGIDSVREIRKIAQYKAMEGSNRVFLLDEVHMLGVGGASDKNAAQNALLKALEDPPPHVYYILCTTNPNNLLSTIRGRCVQIEVKPLRDRELFKLLRQVAQAEGERITKELAEQIAMDSLGHPRNALQILEMALAVPEEKRLEIAKQSAERQSEVIELCRELMRGNSWREVARILRGLKNEDPEAIRRQVLGYCQAVLLNKSNHRAASVMEEFIEPFYNSGMPGLVFACYSILEGE